MKSNEARTAFVVRLRPDRAMTEDQAQRALRAFLKNALRSYGLRCTSAEQEATAEIAANTTCSPACPREASAMPPVPMAPRRVPLVADQHAPGSFHSTN